MNIHFGALAPSLMEQMNEQGIVLDANLTQHAQKDADAITRCIVRGLITTSAAHTARKRLTKRLAEAIKNPKLSRQGGADEPGK